MPAVNAVGEGQGSTKATSHGIPPQIPGDPWSAILLWISQALGCSAVGRLVFVIEIL